MKLYLIRHGEAESENAGQTGRRFREPGSLTDKGRKAVLKAAQHLKKSQPEITEIWHSVKLRAKQTADIIAQELDIENVYKKEGLAPNDPIEKYLEKINDLDDENIAIVGHLPFLPKLASFLLFGAEAEYERISFITAGILCLEKQDEKWNILWTSGVKVI
jgi:phosphohistidine phosphatase